MKGLVFTFGSILLRNWISSRGETANPQQPPFTSIPKLNMPYLAKVGKKYAAQAGSAFIFSLFFVSGSVSAIHSTAQSFDFFGVFIPGAVFYTGFFMAPLSGVVVALNIRSLSRIRVDQSLVYLYEQTPINPGYHSDDSSRSPDWIGFVGPVLTGLISGWTSGRRARSQEKPESPPYQGPRAV